MAYHPLVEPQSIATKQTGSFLLLSYTKIITRDTKNLNNAYSENGKKLKNIFDDEQVRVANLSK